MFFHLPPCGCWIAPLFRASVDGCLADPRNVDRFAARRVVGRAEPGQRRNRRNRRQPPTLADDSGSSSSMAMVLLAPVMVILMFLAWQAALWNHAKTRVRLIAQDTAVLVARSGLDGASAERAARSALDGDDDVQHVDVGIVSSDGLVTVTIQASAPGVVRGTSSVIRVQAVAAIEDWAAS
jgi:Flp pilus assembly protein TadG